MTIFNPWVFVTVLFFISMYFLSHFWQNTNYFGVDFPFIKEMWDVRCEM